MSHDLLVAWVVADRIAVMYLGRIMESGPADLVIRRPRHPYTAAVPLAGVGEDGAHVSKGSM